MSRRSCGTKNRRKEKVRWRVRQLTQVRKSDTLRTLQFCDFGSQYRTAIFYQNETEKRLAEKSKKTLQGRFKQPIVTEIVAASQFYPAEDYHQDFHLRNPVRYQLYRAACGRERRLKEIWGGK